MKNPAEPMFGFSCLFMGIFCLLKKKKFILDTQIGNRVEPMFKVRVFFFSSPKIFYNYLMGFLLWFVWVIIRVEILLYLSFWSLFFFRFVRFLVKFMV